MRARLAILAAKQECELREVVLKDKPQAMLEASAKATVPVLVTGSTDSGVIDESIDIMRWAVSANTPQAWSLSQLDDILVENNDGEFKHFLDRYKYFDRYPEQSQDYYLAKALVFLEALEQNLVTGDDGKWFLKTPQYSALDAAILPFVRQFAFVDKRRFDQLNLPRLQLWLSVFLESECFLNIMQKYSQWTAGQKELILFGG